ncbi:SRPBCC family protein [Mycolicibacterium sp. S2-37]|uniref:SRPBCC family protein n=1 Tax=Mycolicibacterium sp. S2-37 TaxID=2810297 RepID=UPI001A9512C4|nr:SRPBCC family protein [Mycolicibacterium sp. S2-37]MBO0679846.1 SRPBCC family protein [Mycolicibacterium sp. S2-37]
MTPQGTASAQATVDIAADPDVVYQLLTNLSTLADLAEEATEMTWKKGVGTDGAARPGAVFTGSNRNGSRSWKTTCTVTDATAGRSFGFDVRSLVIPVAHWRYEITPIATGCRVTESTWDQRPGWFRTVAGLATGVQDRTAANNRHIQATLDRLKATAEAAR